jgi:hypothetical protein
MAVSLKENNWFFRYGSNSTPKMHNLSNPLHSGGPLNFQYAVKLLPNPKSGQNIAEISHLKKALIMHNFQWLSVMGFKNLHFRSLK